MPLTDNGLSVEAEWTKVSEEYLEYKTTAIYRTWVEASTARHVYEMHVTDEYDGRSTDISVIVAKTGMLLDFLAGGDGMAIGKSATEDNLVDIGYPVNSDVGYQVNGEQAYPTFIRAGWSESSDESTLPVTPCFVLNPTNSAYYYCDGQ